MVTRRQITQVVSVHVLYQIYFCLLFYTLFYALEPFDQWNKKSTIAASVMVNVLFAIAQLVLLWCFIKQKSWLVNNSLCYIPTLVFIIFAIGPYGMTLSFSFQLVNIPYHNKYHTPLSSKLVKNNTHVELCTDLKIDDFNFVILQNVYPLMVITQLIYPYKETNGFRYDTKGQLLLALSFVGSFDMMNFISGIGCIQMYPDGIRSLFHISLIISTFMLAFPVRLEEDDGDDPMLARMISSFITLVFEDVMFFVIRLYIMTHEKSIQSGYNFLVKEVLSACFRSSLLLYHGEKIKATIRTIFQRLKTCLFKPAKSFSVIRPIDSRTRLVPRSS